MTIKLLTTDDELQQYEAWVCAHPESTLWQSLAWKTYQEALGRTVRIYGATLDTEPPSPELAAHSFVATALVVIDRTVGGFSTWDLPRGPLWKTDARGAAEDILDAIYHDARAERCLELTWSPPTPLESTRLHHAPSRRHVQPRATRIVDLTSSEELILAGMHQKGRYNIRLAEKSGVRVRQGSPEDVDALYRLLQSTALRDGFSMAQKSQYMHFLSSLDGSFMLIAEHAEEPIAGLMGVVWGRTGIYYYGASAYEHRALMAPYLLQWRAMQHCRKAGCTTYDLLGVSPAHAAPDDPWLGISDFKRKFGGSIVTYPPEQQCILRPIIYRLLQMKRRYGR